MTTVTATNAKLKVVLDLSKNTAELKALEEQMARIQAGLKESEGKAREENRGRERQAGEANQQAQVGGSGMKFNPLNPLETALSAIGALPSVTIGIGAGISVGGPQLSNLLRTAIETSQTGLPLATGFAKGLLKLMNQKEGGLAQSALATVIEQVTALTNTVGELKAKNDAIAPAFEAMKQLAMAESIAGGTPDLKALSGFGKAMYKIISSRSDLDRSMKRKALEAMGEGAERLIEGMFQ